MRNGRVVTIGLPAGLLYTAAHFFYSGIRQPLANFYGDFLASFPSWRLSVLFRRMDLFNGSLSRKWTYHFGPDPLWHYGPVEHLVTLPMFAFRDLPSAYRAWLYANYAFLFAILVIASMVFFRGRRRWIALAICAMAMFNYNPLYEALTIRAIEIFELLLIFCAFALLQRGREGASGVIVGIAAMTKFLPLIFLPYFLVKRMWRALAGSLIAIVAIAVPTEKVLGWRHSGVLVQLRHLQPNGGFGDQGISGAATRLLRWTHAPLSPAVVTRTLIVIGLAGLSWLFFRIRRCHGADDLEWGTLLIAMVLLAPRTENYYVLFLLFPYLALLANRHGRSAVWLAISFFVTGVVVPLSVVSRLAGADVFTLYLNAGIPFVGAVILAVICVRALLAECGHTVCSLSG